MPLDMAKYRRLFLEESTEHLGEIGHALLSLEKELASAEAIDTVFRMAHSIKSMAASLGYDGIADLAHKIEDRMEGVRRDGRVRGSDELSILFRALEALETMVAAVADDRDPTPADPALLAALCDVSSGGSTASASSPEHRVDQPKKVRR